MKSNGARNCANTLSSLGQCRERSGDCKLMKTFGAVQTSNLKARRAGLHGGLGRERQEKEKGVRRIIPYWDRTFPPRPRRLRSLGFSGDVEVQP